MHEIGKFTIILPSIIYGLFPIPFIETINSIGFINKCLLGLTTIYLFHKSCDRNIFLNKHLAKHIPLFISFIKRHSFFNISFLVFFLTKKNYVIV